MSAQRARVALTIGFKRLANAAKIKDNRNLIGFVSFALLRTNDIDIKRWINYIIFLCFCQIKNANKKNEQDLEQEMSRICKIWSRIYTIYTIFRIIGGIACLFRSFRTCMSIEKRASRKRKVCKTLM